MTYEQLLALHAVVTAGTFRAAADRMHKSQSAISHAIKKLEDEVDIVLLSREDYRPRLTSATNATTRQYSKIFECEAGS